MANNVFVNDYSNAYAVFLPYRISDHSPAILKIPSSSVIRVKPFKFSIFIVYKEGFDDIVLLGWRRVIVGHTMFHVVKKLRDLKKPLRRLMWQQDEECFLQQKSKIEWIRVGDSNTSYFHKVDKGKQHRNHILSVEDNVGNVIEGRDVPVQVPYEKAVHLIRPVSGAEDKSAIFDVGNNKSPGPDGYTVEFYKSFWDIIGDEVTKAVQEFFINGKILANRIKEVLGDIININQSTFVPGRRISDNILLTQELMRNYHLQKGVPRCAFKVDIQKAYDTVSWEFLEVVLNRFGFHRVMVRWIMKCINTVSFSININGELHGYFKGKRGLRQGDPLSPYLFTMVMEVLSLLLANSAMITADFKFHPKCEEQQIINLCFADDLFIFSYMDVPSIKTISDSLDKFKKWSGLVPSMPKSKAYFANVRQTLKDQIMEILPFEEGTLPVKYLGVPLISSRLYYRDCKVLVDNVRNRVENWKNRFLSFAGRLQLLCSVLSSMQVYWQSVFILPSATLNEIEALMRGFLWCQGTLKKGKAKVKWKDVCLPKTEGRNFWNVDTTSNASWSWRKILGVRDQIKNRFVHIIGNGERTSVWYDVWCDSGPLSNYITTRMIYQEGLDPALLIRDMVLADGMNWPVNWYARAPFLSNVTVSLLNDKDDVIKWKDYDGNLHDFAVHWVWEFVRSKAPTVPWVSVIWFTNNIPKHAFVMWLLIGEKLKTQDKLKQWEIANDTPLLCTLCDQVHDSHDHLFFACPFSLQVWNRVKVHIDFLIFSDSWRDFTLLISPFAKRRIARIIVVKLIFAATVYSLWQERNNRLYKKKKRSVDQVYKATYATVRLKIMSIKWKKNPQTLRLKSDWKIS
ncbi:uncharacterized protein [Rutidosis leptorrhynchoides]|uniref:uncharacterized protein n=1 Tax=Rutidosis leptorrhynchoides TaxID=125765 RepID=UPI003A995D29